MHIVNATQLGLCPERMEQIRCYARRNFSGAFRPNQGTEKILALLGSIGPVENWIDLGGGTSTLFWSTGIDAQSITCSDCFPEALVVLSEIASEGGVPECAQGALRVVGRSCEHYLQMKKRIKEYRIVDAHKDWYFGERFQLITQFGTFGLAKNAELYTACVGFAARCMAEGGTMVGANWVLAKEHARRRDLDNTYLAVDVASAAAAKCGLELEFVELVDISAYDDEYDSILVWKMNSSGRG